MAQQTGVTNQQPKTQQKPKPAPTQQQMGPDGGVGELAPESLGLAAAPGVEKQANRLADSRLSVVQRQMMATNLGQMQGNGHLQQVMAYVRQNQANGHTNGNGAVDHKETLAANGTYPLQRQEEMEGDAPTEAEKAAALAAAQAAEAKADQSATQGQNQFNKTQEEKATKQQEGETAKQQAASQNGAAPVEEAAAEGAAKEGSADAAGEAGGEAGPDGGSSGPGGGAGDAAGVDGAAPVEAGPEAKAPASAAEDPAFQGVVTNVKATGAKTASHAPAASKAGEAQSAAESPASEIEGKAQANQVGEMEQAETPAFDQAAFKAQLMARITELSPKNAEEADEFKEDNKLGGVKDEMQGKAAEERDKARGPVEEKAAAAPDTGAVEPKPVTPVPGADPGAAPSDPGAQAAVPKQKGPSEVEQPLKENAKQTEQKMAEAEVTDEQLSKSNEPEFKGALDSKKEAKTQAKTAPQEYRQFEQERIAGAEAEAAATAQAQTQGMHGDRAALFTQVEGQQGQAKTKDEQARAQVAAKIQGIYSKTKTNVEKILTGLDAEVSQAFDAGAAAAKQVFEDYVDAKMTAFKEKRYGGWFGWAKWAKDKIAGMPSEVNVFYSQGRKRYLQEMDAVIDKVVSTIASGLTSAKAEIAAGKQEIHDYVASLPQDLQQVGQQASQDIQSKFDELEENVNSKQNELIDTLANKYQENLQAVDARIDEMKAANAGLVEKALNAVVGVIKVILKLKNMLMTVLAKIADVVGKIIKDPIGFLGNLIAGLKQGFENFGSNILTHLKAGFIGWLTGAMGGVGLQLPEDIFSLEGIFSLVTQVMGITWDYIRAKAVKLLGEPVVNALETAFEPFKILVTEGPMGLWEYVKEQFNDLKTMVMDQIQDLLITQVIKAGIKWILGLMNPAGAFVKAAMAIYEIVMFFVNKGSQIMELVNSIVDSVAAIASGGISGAAKMVEGALAKALPLAIGFLASLLGISGLAKKVQGIIQKVRGKIDKAIDKFLLKAKKIGRKLLRKLGIGGKDAEDEGEAGSTPEEQHKVIGQAAAKDLAKQPSKDMSYEELRIAKQEQAKTLEDKYNKQLEDPVKMSISFEPADRGQEDGELDAEIRIAPNDWVGTIQVDSKEAEQHADIIAELVVKADQTRSEYNVTTTVVESEADQKVIKRQGNVATAKVEVDGIDGYPEYTKLLAEMSGAPSVDDMENPDQEIPPREDERATRQNRKDPRFRRDLRSAVGNRERQAELYARSLKENLTDSERKLYMKLKEDLRELAGTMNIDPTKLSGKLYIYTERHPCTGCVGNTQDFADIFPNLEIRIFYTDAYS